MDSGQFFHRLDEQLAARRDACLLRTRRVIDIIDSTHVRMGGRVLVNFSSNDYLGLSHHPRVLAAARSALDAAGAGASPLVAGYTIHHAAAEANIAQWKQTQSAVLLSSGYQAAHAAIGAIAASAASALTGGRPIPPGRAPAALRIRFLLDKLCHASLLDAVAASGAPYRVFPHNGLDKLRRLLGDASADELQVVVTESIFSMDGDAADLPGIAELQRSHGFLLVLDEAHASGVYSSAGAGYAAECALADIVDVSIVTLSKAAGVAGGAVCGSQALCDAVVNWGRAYIYSTAMPPSSAAAISAAIVVMRDEPQRQARVRELARRVREELSGRGVKVLSGDSPIIPIIFGDEEKALAAAASLEEQGLLVVAIRPPTVARGTSRLRVTLSCEHTEEEVERLIEAIKLL